MKPKADSGKIDKIDKPPATLAKKKSGHKSPISRMTEVCHFRHRKRMGKECLEQFCSHKLSSLSEMDQNPRATNTQYELDNSISPITSKEIEPVVRWVLRKKVSDGFTGKLRTTFKELQGVPMVAQRVKDLALSL